MSDHSEFKTSTNIQKHRIFTKYLHFIAVAKILDAALSRDGSAESPISRKNSALQALVYQWLTVQHDTFSPSLDQ